MKIFLKGNVLGKASVFHQELFFNSFPERLCLPRTSRAGGVASFAGCAEDGVLLCSPEGNPLEMFLDQLVVGIIAIKNKVVFFISRAAFRAEAVLELKFVQPSDRILVFPVVALTGEKTLADNLLPGIDLEVCEPAESAAEDIQFT